MAIPNVYRKNADSPIASYSWTDLIQNVGYKTFYPTFIQQGASGAKYKIMTPERLYSAQVSSGGDTQSIDNTFDLTFQKQSTIVGDVIISIPVLVYGNIAITASASVYKVVDGTATQLGSTASGSYTTSHGAQYLWGSTGMNITIPNTSMGTGHIFRLRVQSTAPGSGKAFYMYHDPASRSQTNAPAPEGSFGIMAGNLVTGVQSTATEVNIPFPIDL